MNTIVRLRTVQDYTDVYSQTIYYVYTLKMFAMDTMIVLQEKMKYFVISQNNAQNIASA